MHLTLGIVKRQCVLTGRCSLEARSPNLRQSQAVFYALAFFPGLSSRTGWLDGFAVPAPAQVYPTGTIPLRGLWRMPLDPFV